MKNGLKAESNANRLCITDERKKLRIDVLFGLVPEAYLDQMQGHVKEKL